MNRINAFRLQGYKSLDGIRKVFTVFRDEPIPTASNFFQGIRDHARRIQACS